MLFEYAVEPQMIGASWIVFRLLIEKFGFDRGRLISQFPKAWLKEVYAASAAMNPIERKRLEESLNRAKRTKIIPSRRSYDPSLGDWFQNAVAQQTVAPFHAIIAAENPNARADVVLAGDADEDHPLMISGHTWEVARVGATLAVAMGPLLRSAHTVLLVDRYFDIGKSEYRETLQACLAVLNSTGHADVRCEIHFCDHDKRAPTAIVERDAPKWLRGIVPAEMSIALFAWRERAGGEDFHARYLLTDVGGINVEAGFSADGQHQQVQLSLLDFDFSQRKLNTFRRGSPIYELVEPVLVVSSDGTVGHI